MYDYDGETTNEATNLSFSSESPKKGGLSRNSAAVATTLVSRKADVPLMTSLPQRWCTGENLTGPEIIYTNVPNSVYKHTIYMEGKYQIMLVGILRMQGYGNNVGIDELYDNLEVIKRPVSEATYKDIYQEVYDILQAKIQAALQVPVVESPTEYRKLHSEGKFLSTNEAVPASVKKNKDSRGAVVCPHTTSRADSLLCQHAHRFPVKVSRHDDHCLGEQVRCDHLHMRHLDGRDEYELCHCLTGLAPSSTPVSLFAHVTNENAAASNAADLPYCANCQAIKDNSASK